MPLRESMCDVCMSPGHCCQLIALSGSNPDPTKQPQQPMSFEAAEHFLLKSNHSMFRPAFQDEKGIWRFTCTALQPNGRCGIYDERPMVCRLYEPGTDRLCVHFVEKGE